MHDDTVQRRGESQGPFPYFLAIVILTGAAGCTQPEPGQPAPAAKRAEPSVSPYESDFVLRELRSGTEFVAGGAGVIRADFALVVRSNAIAVSERTSDNRNWSEPDVLTSLSPLESLRTERDVDAFVQPILDRAKTLTATTRDSYDVAIYVDRRAPTGYAGLIQYALFRAGVETAIHAGADIKGGGRIPFVGQLETSVAECDTWVLKYDSLSSFELFRSGPDGRVDRPIPSPPADNASVDQIASLVAGVIGAETLPNSCEFPFRLQVPATLPWVESASLAKGIYQETGVRTVLLTAIKVETP